MADTELGMLGGRLPAPKPQPKPKVVRPPPGKAGKLKTRVFHTEINPTPDRMAKRRAQKR